MLMSSFAEGKLWYVCRVCSVCVFVNQFKVSVQNHFPTELFAAKGRLFNNMMLQKWAGTCDVVAQTLQAGNRLGYLSLVA
jgi:hypothetical protein